MRKGMRGSSSMNLQAADAMADGLFLTPSQRRESLERAQAEKNPIHVHIVLPANGMHEIALRKSLNSLMEQTYTHWDCVVVHDTKDTAAPAIITTLQRSCKNPLSTTHTAEKRTCAHLHSCYQIHLPLHAQLRDDALEQLASAAALHPHAALRCALLPIAFDDHPLAHRAHATQHYCDAQPRESVEDPPTVVTVDSAFIYVPTAQA